MSEIKELTDVCREILIWVKFSNFSKVKDILETSLKTEEKKLTYHLSDGKNTSREIAAIVGPSPKTISNWWDSWFTLGIVTQEIVKGGGTRSIKIFELKTFGIEVPQIKIDTEKIKLEAKEENVN